MHRNLEPDGELLGGAVLGVGWRTEEDKFFFKVSINLSNRCRGEPTGPNLTVDRLYLVEQAVLTNRICLSVEEGMGELNHRFRGGEVGVRKDHHVSEGLWEARHCCSL